jgi:hypothetical protein
MKGRRQVPFLLLLLLLLATLATLASGPALGDKTPCLLVGLDQRELARKLVEYYTSNPQEAQQAALQTTTGNATLTGYLAGSPEDAQEASAGELQPCLFFDVSDFALYRPVLRLSDPEAIVALAEALPTSSYLKSAAAFYRYFMLLQSLQSYCNETRRSMFEQFLGVGNDTAADGGTAAAANGTCAGCKMDKAAKALLYVVENAINVACYLYDTYKGNATAESLAGSAAAMTTEQVAYDSLGGSSGGTRSFWDSIADKLESWGISHGLAFRPSYIDDALRQKMAAAEQAAEAEADGGSGSGETEQDVLKRFDDAVGAQVELKRAELDQSLRETRLYKHLVDGVARAASDPSFGRRLTDSLADFYDKNSALLTAIGDMPRRISERLQRIRLSTADRMKYAQEKRAHGAALSEQELAAADPLQSMWSAAKRGYGGMPRSDVLRERVERGLVQGVLGAAEYLKGGRFLAHLRSAQQGGVAAAQVRHGGRDGSLHYYETFNHHYYGWQVSRAMARQQANESSVALRAAAPHPAGGYFVPLSLRDGAEHTAAEADRTARRHRLLRRLRAHSDSSDASERLERMNRMFVGRLSVPLPFDAGSKEPFSGYAPGQNNVLQLFSLRDVMTWIKMQINVFFFNARTDDNREQCIAGFPELVSFEYGCRAVVIDDIPVLSLPDGLDPNDPHCDDYDTSIWDRMRWSWYMSTNWFLYPLAQNNTNLQPMLNWAIYDPQGGTLPPNIYLCAFMFVDAFDVLFSMAFAALWLLGLYLSLYIWVDAAERAESQDGAIGEATVALVAHKSTYDTFVRGIKRENKMLSRRMQEMEQRLDAVMVQQRRHQQ